MLLPLTGKLYYHLVSRLKEEALWSISNQLFRLKWHLTIVSMCSSGIHGLLPPRIKTMAEQTDNSLRNSEYLRASFWKYLKKYYPNLG